MLHGISDLLPGGSFNKIPEAKLSTHESTQLEAISSELFSMAVYLSYLEAIEKNTRSIKSDVSSLESKLSH